MKKLFSGLVLSLALFGIAYFTQPAREKTQGVVSPKVATLAKPVALLPADSAPISTGEKEATAEKTEKPVVSPAVQEARQLVESNKMAEAIEVLEKEVKRNPSDEMAFLDLGLLLSESGQDPQKVEATFKKALELNPNSRLALGELMNKYMAESRFAEGNRVLDEVARKGNHTSDFLAQKATFLLAQGKTEDAIQNYQAASQDPKIHKVALSGMAEAYTQSGDYDRAVETYQKLVGAVESQIKNGGPKADPRLENELIGTQYDLTQAYIVSGNLDEAEAQLRQLKEKAPGHPGLQDLEAAIRAARSS